MLRKNPLRAIFAGRFTRYAWLLAILGAGTRCTTNSVSVVGESPLNPGIYVGDRSCNSNFNGTAATNTDSISFTIDNSGLLVLNGQTIHVGLVNEFDAGNVNQTSVIEAIAITADGFTIDWDTTITIGSTRLEGFVLESFKAIDADSFEFRSTLVATSSNSSYTDNCIATMSR